MKKILSMLLIVAVLMSCFVLSVGAEETELTAAEISLLKMQRADADANGKYDVADATLILSAAMGTVSEDEKYDVDSDGAVSVRDALAVLKAASGITPIVSNEELVDIVNLKLNGVKTEKPGFTGVSTAQCTSMKVTQKGTASGSLAFLIQPSLDEMACTDLEYDKYVEKMVAQLESSKTEDKKPEEIADIDKQIAAMNESAETYREAEVANVNVAKLNSSGHRNYFPIAGQAELASALTTDYISKITFSLSAGEIAFNITMKNYSYTNATYPKTSDELINIPYGKVFNLPFLRNDSDSTLTSAEYKNGKIKVVLDKETADIKQASYSYAYSSAVKSPTQTMEIPEFSTTATIDMSTKMYATIKEEFEFKN